MITFDLGWSLLKITYFPSKNICIVFTFNISVIADIIASGRGALRRTPIMQHVIVVDVHEHGDRLANDQRHPDGSVAIVSPQESAHKIGQRDLKQEVECEMRNFIWCSTSNIEYLRLTCAIIPRNAQSRNIFRGTLTKYWQKLHKTLSGILNWKNVLTWL